jgi:Ras-related protein Rab-1A
MMSNIRYAMNMKLIFIGDPSVGKTSLLRRFTEDVYKPNSPSTLGVDFVFKDYEVKGTTVKLQIWDTAGQERYRSMIDSYYKHSQGIIMVFDLTDEQSFDNILNQWMPSIVSHLGNVNPKFLVLGNKKDLSNNRSQLFDLNQVKCQLEQLQIACFRDIDLNKISHYQDDLQKVSYNFNGGRNPAFLFNSLFTVD